MTAFQPSDSIPVERQAYFFEGGEIGVLYSHGFMGSPKSSRHFGEYLHSRGLTVSGLRLPGHGHLPYKIHRVSYREWLAEAEKQLQRLRKVCRTVVVAGHSMGSIVAAHLAARETAVAGLLLFAPMFDLPDRRLRLLRFVRPIIPWLYPLRLARMRPVALGRVTDFDPSIDLDDPAVQAWLRKGTRIPTSGIDEMRKLADYGRRLWPRVSQPTIIFQGLQDDVSDPALSRQIYAALTTPHKQLVEVPHTGHHIIRPSSPTHQEVWQQAADFVYQLSGAG